MPSYPSASNVTWEITKNPADAWVQRLCSVLNRQVRCETTKSQFLMQETFPRTEEREAILTLAATDAGATESVDITLTQEALRFSVDMTALNVGAARGSVTLNVSANLPWELTETADWIIIVGDATEAPMIKQSSLAMRSIP